MEDDVVVTWTLKEGEGYTISPDAASAEVLVEDDDVAEFALSIDPAEIEEGESATLEVKVTNGVTFKADQTIEFNFSGSTATKDTDYTVSPAAPILSAGRRRTTATIAALADSGTESDETVSVAASHNGTAIGTVSLTIQNATVPPLTAEFLGMPASHDGENWFEFELRFSEEFPLSFRTLRDEASRSRREGFSARSGWFRDPTGAGRSGYSRQEPGTWWWCYRPPRTARRRARCAPRARSRCQTA